MCVKSSGVAPGLTNARLPSSTKFVNALPRDGQGKQMPCSNPGRGGVGGAGRSWN